MTTIHDDRLEALSRQVRTLKVLAASLFVAVGSLFLLAFAPQDRDEGKRFDELTVGTLNVAGPDGVKRMILSHEMPQAPFQGKMLKRGVPPGAAGMIFCAPNGDEVGGIGASSGHTLVMMDYRETPLEAIGFLHRRTADGNQSAGMILYDNPTGPIDIDKLMQGDAEEGRRFQEMRVNRVWLGIGEHDASLRLRDRSGRDRIVIGVDADNQPVIQMLDEDGEEIARLP